MGTVRRWVRARLVEDESGMSIAELIVSMFIFTFVLVAILNLLDTSTKVAANDTERPLAIREAQSGLHRMTRDIRQGYVVNEIDPRWVDFNVTINGQHLRVRYECNYQPVGKPY